MLNNYWHGILMVVCTALFWGGMSPTAKVITSAGLSQITVVAYRSVFIVVVMGLFLYLKYGKDKFFVSGRILKMYFFLGILSVAINATGFLMSCSYLSVPKALILHYTFPLVTMAGARFITNEKPSLVQLLAGFMILLGLYVGFVLGGSDDDPASTAGILWGAASVIGFSGQTLLSRSMGKDENADPMLQLFFSSFFGGAVLILLNSVFRGWPDLVVMTPRLFLIIQYPAFFAGLLAFGFLFSALKYIPASTASLVCSLEIVFALMLAPIIIKQLPSFYEIIGALIVLTAVATSMLLGKRG